MDHTLNTTLSLLNSSETTATFQSFTTATTAQTVQLTTIQSWTEGQTGNTSTNLVNITRPGGKNEPSQLSDGDKIGIGISITLLIIFIIFTFVLRKLRSCKCTTQQEQPDLRPVKPNGRENAVLDILRDVESTPGLSGYASAGHNSTYEIHRYDEEEHEKYCNDGFPIQTSEFEKESLACGRDGIVELKRHLPEIKSDLSSESENKSFSPSVANKIATKPEFIVENEIIGAHCCEPDTERVVFLTSSDLEENVGKMATQSQEADIEQERRRATFVAVELTVGVFFDNGRKQFRLYWARKTGSVETKIEKVESKRSSYLTTPWMLFEYNPRGGATLMQLKMVVNEESDPKVLQEKMIALSERQINTVTFNYCAFDLPHSCRKCPHGLQLLISQGDYTLPMEISLKKFENQNDSSIKDILRCDSGFGSSSCVSIVSGITPEELSSIRGADFHEMGPPVTTQPSVVLPYGLNTEQVPREIHDEIIKFERSEPEVGKQAQPLFNLTIGLFDKNGGVLVLKGDDKVTLTVPEGAIHGEQLNYIYADLKDPNKPQVDECLYSPEIDCGPDGTIFQKQVVLTIPHYAINPEDIEPQSRSRDGTEYTDFDSSCDDEVIRFQLIHFTRQRGRKQSGRRTARHSSCDASIIEDGLILTLGVFHEEDKNELRVYQTKCSDLYVKRIEKRENRNNSTLVILYNQFPYDHQGSDLLIKFFHEEEKTMQEVKCINKHTVERTDYSYVRFTLPVNYKKCSVTIEQTHPGEESPTKVELFESFQKQAQADDDIVNGNLIGAPIPFEDDINECSRTRIGRVSGYESHATTTNLQSELSVNIQPENLDESTTIELLSDSTLDPFSYLDSDLVADNLRSSSNPTQATGQSEDADCEKKPDVLSEWMDSEPINDRSSPSNEKPGELTVNELGNTQDDDLSSPVFNKNNISCCHCGLENKCEHAYCDEKPIENEILDAHGCGPDTEGVAFPTFTDPDENVGKMATQSQEADIEEERQRAAFDTVELTVGVFFDDGRKQFRVYWGRKTGSVETKIKKVESKRSSYLTTPWMLFVYNPRRGNTLMQLKMVVNEESVPEVLQEKMIGFSKRQINTVSFNYCSFTLPESCGEFPHSLQLLISQGDYALPIGIAVNKFENPNEPSIKDNPRYDSDFESSEPASIISDITAEEPLSVRAANSNDIDLPVTTQPSVVLPYGLNTKQVPREIHDEVIKFGRSNPEAGKHVQPQFNLAIGLFDQNGGVLVLKGDDKVTLTVPEGAIHGEQLIYIYADLKDLYKPQVDECLYSPEIDCGPDGTIFQKPVVLTIPHSAINPEDIEPQSRCCDGLDYTDFDSNCDDEVIQFELIHFSKQRGRKKRRSSRRISRRTTSQCSRDASMIESGLILTLGVFHEEDKNELRVYCTKCSQLIEQKIEQREGRENSNLVALWNQFPYDHQGSDLLVKFFHGVEGTIQEEKRIDKRTVERTDYNYVRFTLPVNYKKCSITIEQTHPVGESPTELELFEIFQRQAPALADDDDAVNLLGGEAPIPAEGDINECNRRPTVRDSGYVSRPTTTNSTYFLVIPIPIDRATQQQDPNNLDESTAIEVVSDYF